MKLLVFLGNPGLKYRKTRHNIGFMVGDWYAVEHGVKFKRASKFSADVAQLDGKITLVKPQLFYNRAGESVKKIVDFYKIAVSDILVVCDDFNLDLGKIRIRMAGRDGGNNGLKSIIAMLGSDHFTRIRVGTDNNTRSKIGDTDFVLSRLNRDEQTKLPEICTQVTHEIDKLICK